MKGESVRGSSGVERAVHTREVGGANPSPATIKDEETNPWGMVLKVWLRGAYYEVPASLCMRDLHKRMRRRTRRKRRDLMRWKWHMPDGRVIEGVA